MRLWGFVPTAFFVSALGFFAFSSFALALGSNFRGTVISVLPCLKSSANYVVLGNGKNTTALIYTPPVFNLLSATGTPPTVGQYISGTTEGLATCVTNFGNQSFTISKPAFFFYASTTPSIPGTPPLKNPAQNSGGPSNILFTLQKLFPSLFSNQVGGAGAPNPFLHFGGRVTTIIPGDLCEVVILAGLPYSGPLIWTPAVTPPYRINFLAPPVPSQCITGDADAPITCFLGGVPVGVGPRFTYYGSGAPVCTAFGGSGGPSTSKPPTPAQCPQSGFNVSNSAGKAEAEAATRNELSNYGVTTNVGACGLGVNGVTHHCTDVGTLACGTMSALENLASKCGGFQISGGSEAGHSAEHSTGNAVDISHSASLDSCIMKNFNQIHCPSQYRANTSACWLDPSAKSIYWAEPTVSGEPAHWHVCFNGYCHG